MLRKHVRETRNKTKEMHICTLNSRCICLYIIKNKNKTNPYNIMWVGNFQHPIMSMFFKGNMLRYQSFALPKKVTTLLCR